MNPNQGRIGQAILAQGLRHEYSRYNAARRSLVIASKLYSKKTRTPDESDSLANGSNAIYIDKLYSKWSKDPGSVDQSWDAYFSGKPRSILSSRQRQPKKRKWQPTSVAERPASSAPNPAPQADWKYIDDHLVVQAIIRAYQTRGHLAADLDPLGIVGPTGHSLATDDKKLQATRAVLRQHYSYIFNDLNALFKLPKSTLIGGDEEFLPLREILDRLERVYCGHIGVEYMMITSIYKSNWIREQFEKPGVINFKPEEKKLILERLTRSTGFENFLAKKFSSEKRFGLEGCDIMIPVMKEIIDQSNKCGVESVLIGMAHRGRLNVLANVCRKPMKEILSQFHGLRASDWGSGDVKYHLGLFTERLNRQSNKNVRITVVANPSHLEYVNPVVLGKARAEMFLRGDYQGNKVLPMLIHGDASFCGQGVVYESIHMSDLPAYTTHGTIHVVSNNQVGFTTDPRFSRSSRYCTDVARVVNAPIFHVNADDPEACVHCARVAALWRAKFHKDVVIDIVGYRRNGHNEADEPMFTQPLMYQRIRKLKNCTVQYAEKLTRDGVIKMEEYTEMVKKYDTICNEAFEESKKIKTFKNSHWLDSPWSGYFQGRDRLRVCPTGVNLKTLQHIGEIYSSPPPAEHKFEVHKGILRILGLRKNMVKEKIADWSLGEAFAIGTLVKDGIHVRVSGQDVERGTFSHRHHVLHHQTKDKVRYNSLQHLYPDQAPYDVCNSSLSECAILGFETGYSMANPNTLVIWEAQFGDFANTAQPIIDTFLASGETKWVRQSGLCVFLPHSMEGMGPEHSSGRMERFLQLSDDDPDCFPDMCDADLVARQLMNTNWIVTNVTTPANLFHVLRRQVALGFRKPLINFSPKSVLRHPKARSPFRDFNECSSFQRIIPDTGKAGENPDCVKQLVFCSGKVYYDLLKEREDHEQESTCALVRVEQVCPFPYDLILEQINKYKGAELVWFQEEHKNQGAWSYIQPRFDTTILKMEGESRGITYQGRPPNSASSTGNKVQHYSEYDAIMTGLFGELTEENKKRIKEIKEQEQKAAVKQSEASLAKAKQAKMKEEAEKKAGEKKAGEKKEGEKKEDQTAGAKGAPPAPTGKANPPKPSAKATPAAAAGPPTETSPSPARKPMAAEPPTETSPSPARKSAPEAPTMAPSPARKPGQESAPGMKPKLAQKEVMPSDKSNDKREAPKRAADTDNKQDKQDENKSAKRLKKSEDEEAPNDPTSSL
ncbi:2-oxoglutarate dehydrogenase-like, mitochondrial [Drosophila novamexicana]|uniref:2-oxoglutarate dehydrogenase-like, mitochondrial n=1 Tax=Drosophila novamexicana TaxID=47314 RepID=UPI0011E5D979|nr:2-oxoglutarate dehydrogenase-like, mitochondrial [Drosophila novamexicana]